MFESILAIVGIGSFTVTISMAWYIKKSLSTNSIIEKIEDIADEVMTNKELQQKIYVIGALLGNGIKQGLGFQSKGGKMKFEDIAIGAVAELAKKYLPGIFGGGTEQQQPQQEGFKPWEGPQ